MIVAGITDPIVNVLATVIDWLGPHGAVGLQWPWAIVALTVLVRMALVWLTVKQIHSMQNLQRHAPEMKELQRKYKHDKEKQREELMKFYRERNINPAASCLPILVQIPIFISLFFLLKNFTTDTDYQRGDNLEWLGLINILEDVTVGWGPLLLVIYVGSQLASTYFMAATVDRTQRILFFAIPFVALPFIVNFKAGLVLYWATTNLWTVGQGVVTRRLVPRTKVAPLKRTSRTPPRQAGGEGEAGDGAKAEEPAPKPGPAAAGTPGRPRRVKRKRRRGGARR
jgi:YidC/Oxa1 family membrane protein insertase